MNKTQQRVLDIISANPGITLLPLMRKAGKSDSMVKRGLSILLECKMIRFEARPNPGKPGTHRAWFATPESADDAPIRQKVVAIGKWKAKIPAVRSVFDLGIAA
jgi:hypothetical protein